MKSSDCDVVASVTHDINGTHVDNLDCIIYTANATALIQPLDQGIIAMVKARYRAWFLRWLIDLDHRPPPGGF